MKKLFLLFFIGLHVFFTSCAQNPVLAAEIGDTAILYYGNGCPHCAKVNEFLQNHKLSIEIEHKEIYQNAQNAEEFNLLRESQNIDVMDRGVPFLYANKECIIGDRPIIDYLQGYQAEIASEPVAEPVTEPLKTIDVDMETPVPHSLTLPILIGGALVDSINPCEFAVLLILMTTILASGNRKKALLSGIAYSTSIFISYFLMGLGLYSVAASIGSTSIFIRIIGIIAMIIGIFNLKDFFWYGKFFVMEVPLSWRPKLKSLVRSITGPISAFFIGFLVSLFLLPCTSGPYIVILGMLGHGETYTKAVWLLVLYNFIFVLPMLAITVGVYFGMNVEKAEATRSRNLKVLHLIAGIIMLGMGFVLALGIF